MSDDSDLLPTPPGTPSPTKPEPDRGADLARQALEQARAAARARGMVRRAAGTGGRGRGSRSRRTRPTGAGPDEWDPQPLGAEIGRLLSDRGWEDTVRTAGVLHRWDAFAGPELAAHCQPESLVDGELVLVAESTAWATQVRLLAPQLLARLADQLGAGVVRRVKVHGPTAPSWSRGPRRVAGRGPRDTYG